MDPIPGYIYHRHHLFLLRRACYSSLDHPFWGKVAIFLESKRKEHSLFFLFFLFTNQIKILGNKQATQTGNPEKGKDEMGTINKGRKRKIKKRKHVVSCSVGFGRYKWYLRPGWIDRFPTYTKRLKGHRESPWFPSHTHTQIHIKEIGHIQ